MHRVVDISLSGHPDPLRLHEDAYAALTQYLDSARARLADDPDGEEVIGDLELSIGEKLTSRLSGGKRVLDAGDVQAVLDEVGAVDGKSGAPKPAVERRDVRRRLYRIREGQWFAGICQGLAAYADLRVDVVRTIFVLLTVVTAGGFLLLYVAMMFIVPVVETRAEYLATQEEPEVPEGARQHR